MNILGRKNKSQWQADVKNKKENHITISNDLGAVVAELLKEILNINTTLKEINLNMISCLRKLNKLERRVERLENERKLHK